MLKKEQYLKTVRRPYPPFYWSLIFSGISNEAYYRDLISKPFAFRNQVFVDSVLYYSLPETIEGGKIALEAWSDIEYFKTAQANFLEREKIFLQSTTSGFDVFCQAFESYTPSLTIIFALDKPVNDSLRHALLQKISQSEVNVLMDQLNIPLEDNYYKQEEYDLVTSTNFEQHVQKYVWLHSRYGDDVSYTLEEAKNHLEKIDKDDYLASRAKQKAELKKVISRAKEIVGFKNSYLVDLMQYIIYYRTQRTDIINRAAYQYIAPLKQLAHQNQLSYAELLHCTKDEILNHIPSSEVIASRQKEHAVLWKMEQ